MSMAYKPELTSGLYELAEKFDMDFKQKVGNNLALKMGVVVEIIETDSPTSQTKLVPEYHVMVLEKNNTSIYKNCIATDTFGGIADYLQFRHRQPENPKKVRDSGSFKNQEGSIVLLLCRDGNAEQAIIVGAINHPAKKDVLSKQKGHHLEGEFNGLNFSIDKDGALRVEFKSATDSKGKPSNTSAGGTYLNIEKDGSIELADGNVEKVRIDKTNKTIVVEAEKDISLSSTKENIKVSAQKNIEINSVKDLLADASGNANITVGKALNIKASKAVNISGQTATLKGSTKAAIEASQIQLKGSIIQLGSGGTPALTLNTQFIGVGNLGAPVVSLAVGPFSTTVFIA